jgi:hypothetical protein
MLGWAGAVRRCDRFCSAADVVGSWSRQHLRDIGIAVTVDLPGVGFNFHDHVMAPVVYSYAIGLIQTEYVPWLLEGDQADEERVRYAATKADKCVLSRNVAPATRAAPASDHVGGDAGLKPQRVRCGVGG